MNAQQTRALDSPPSPLLSCFQLGKNVIEKWEPGHGGKSKLGGRHHPHHPLLTQGARKNPKAKNAPHPVRVRALSGVCSVIVQR
jgi:hypothetical protein